MKELLTKKEFERALNRAKKAQYLVDTNRFKTVNLVLLAFEDENICGWWANDEAPSKSNLRFLAYGDAHNGEVLIHNLGEPPGSYVVGKGHANNAKVLIIQKDEDGFVVVFNDDSNDSLEPFLFTGNYDVVLVQLVAHLASAYFPNVDRGRLTDAVNYLFKGSSGDNEHQQPA